MGSAPHLLGFGPDLPTRRVSVTRCHGASGRTNGPPPLTSEPPLCTIARLRGLRGADWLSPPAGRAREPAARATMREPSTCSLACVTSGLCARRRGAPASGARIAGCCDRGTALTKATTAAPRRPSTSHKRPAPDGPDCSWRASLPNRTTLLPANHAAGPLARIPHAQGPSATPAADPHCAKARLAGIAFVSTAAS
jgi:hypothetical protein